MCCLYLYQMWYDVQHFYLSLHQMWYSLQHFCLSLSQMCDYLQHFYLSLNQMYYYLQLMYPGDENVSVSLFVNMASPINVSHGTKTVSTSLFFNTVRISDKKFTCAAVNHATSQFAHKKKLTAQWFGPVAGLPAVNWNSLTSLQFCPSKPCNLAVRFKKS